jgi:hypothetical protein
MTRGAIMVMDTFIAQEVKVKFNMDHYLQPVIPLDAA